MAEVLLETTMETSKLNYSRTCPSQLEISGNLWKRGSMMK